MFRNNTIIVISNKPHVSHSWLVLHVLRIQAKPNLSHLPHFTFCFLPSGSHSRDHNDSNSCKPQTCHLYTMETTAKRRIKSLLSLTPQHIWVSQAFEGSGNEKPWKYLLYIHSVKRWTISDWPADYVNISYINSSPLKSELLPQKPWQLFDLLTSLLMYFSLLSLCEANLEPRKTGKRGRRGKRVCVWKWKWAAGRRNVKHLILVQWLFTQ